MGKFSFNLLFSGVLCFIAGQRLLGLYMKNVAVRLSTIE